jgi:hypothetical protein
MTDLKDAENGIAGTTNTNAKITLPLVQAMLAKVYLYRGVYDSAVSYATKVISNNSFRLEPSLDTVFLRSSKETIFKISSDGSNTTYVNYTPLAFSIIPRGISTPPYQITSWLYNAFETGDLRKTRWTASKTITPNTYYYPMKYKRNATPANPVQAEDLVLFRLAEVYLIRAEASAQLNDITTTVNDLNAIRSRAGLTPLSYSLSQSDALLATEQERRVELFSEGNRWFDLIRTGRANAVLGSEKTTWTPGAVLIPVPQSQILLNPNLGN